MIPTELSMQLDPKLLAQMKKDAVPMQFAGAVPQNFLTPKMMGNPADLSRFPQGYKVFGNFASSTA